MPDLDDNSLLQQYAEENSEEAFAAIVSRHINKVYSVALRHTRNPSQAEEVTQAVFVIFAKRANSLGKRVVLSGWLYQTARLASLTFLKSEFRRARREQEAHVQTALNEPADETWTEIAPLLDSAMGTLNETDRHAVVLRFFDGKSMREVGTALGASEDTAKKRVSRALEKLRGFFARHGVHSTTAIIAGAISSNSVQAAPQALAHSVTVAAIAKGAAASGSTLTLVKGALKVMAWTKAKTVVAVSVALILAAGTACIAVKMLWPKASEAAQRQRPAPASLQQVEARPGFALLKEAVSFLHHLKIAGELPGFGENDKCWVVLQPIPTNVDRYPIVVELRARKVNVAGPFPYHFKVTKTSGANDWNNWKLLAAWRTDVNGKVVEKFSVQ